jgi:hypothetical protein
LFEAKIFLLEEKGPQVPTTVESIVTKKATRALTQMLSRLIWSWKMPTRSGRSPKTSPG